ncbi:MAG: Crp/Fnr family transcriptional regulator [Deltaproteobacteria bacterium]|nr:Crp/Fnr family transcriptional regulator [Deltaproteobacteria bacterium]
MDLEQALLLITSPGHAPEELWSAHAGRSVLTRPDQAIYSVRDPLDQVYLLVDGMVRLYVGEAKKARTSLFLRAPALFGDRDLVAGCTVSQESAQSVAQARLLSWPAATLAALLGSAGPARDLVLCDLVRRYARSSRFSDYLALPLAARLTWLLLELAAGGDRLLPRYEILARLADSSAKSVGRAIGALQQAGTLRLENDRRFALAAAAKDELGVGELLGLFHRLVAL